MLETELVDSIGEIIRQQKWYRGAATYNILAMNGGRELKYKQEEGEWD